MAELFQASIPNFLQPCNNFFLSKNDINGGDAWFSAITTELDDSPLALVFITRENKDSPWLNIEAGAFLGKLGRKKVIPILVDLKKPDYDGPLNSLQVREATDQEEMRNLLTDIDTSMEYNIPPKIIDHAFSTFYQQFSDKISEEINNNNKKSKVNTRDSARSQEHKINEILLYTRSISQRLDNISSDSQNSQHAFLTNEITNDEMQNRRIIYSICSELRRLQVEFNPSQIENPRPNFYTVTIKESSIPATIDKREILYRLRRLERRFSTHISVSITDPDNDDLPEL
ncbi:toll/interleukin-1 receptor domain-containing protein [Bifidobacterium sp. ESL0775]|uniref:toll/interleukin-1 receptor domain-containing protein n=1 Tax=Bifidobacterium sp. ESL0775 TaxID=2983230 RepID=UPI0023F9508D|nr:toll/interleukin-1 receptor domain-containing protein [Bifidobacterium sp. ESL0775]WEV68913.1 toll/interleukin-1 receptor domain-containing protein [Bifidobacterium sp. ESL0775]